MDFKTKLKWGMVWIVLLATSTAMQGQQTSERSGKVFFTATDMGKSAFESAEKITEWDLSDDLYFRYFFEKPASEVDEQLGDPGTGNHRKAQVIGKVFLDDSEILEVEVIDFSDKEGLYKEATTLREQMYIRSEVAAALSGKPYGAHTLRVENYLKRKGEKSGSTLLAAGEITIQYGEGMKKALRKDEEVCFEPSAMSNATLEKKFLAASNAAKDGGDTYFEKSDRFSKVRIIEAEWRTQKNDYSGRIEGRAIDAILTGRDQEGNCIKQLVGFYQEYQGAGKYGNLSISGASESEMIPCLCVE